MIKIIGLFSLFLIWDKSFPQAKRPGRILVVITQAGNHFFYLSPLSNDLA